MVKAKRWLVAALSAVLLMASAVMLLSKPTAGVKAEGEVALGVSIESGKLLLAAENAAGKNCKFWMKTLVQTDTNADNEVTSQYIWQSVDPLLYKDGYSAELDITALSLDGNGNYSFLLDVTDALGRQTYYRAVTAEEAGAAKILSLTYNGVNLERDAVSADRELPLALGADTAGATDVEVYLVGSGGNVLLSEVSGGYDISDLEIGEYKLLVKAVGTLKSDSRILTLFVTGDYDVSSSIVLTSITYGEKNGFSTEFIIGVSYADGSAVPDSLESSLRARISSQSGVFYSQANGFIKNGNDITGISVTMDFVGTGVFLLDASLLLDGARIDYAREYYYDNAQAATLDVTADKDVKALVAGEAVEFSASGTVDGVAIGDVRYAYYREDASGWVLIRAYDQSPVFTWNPVRAGRYNIQARIKGVNSASYEQVKTIECIVGAGSVSQMPSLTIEDMQGDEAENIFAGVPYVIRAQYSGSESVLYKYTLYTRQTLSEYLTCFSVSPEYVFTALKPGEYIVSVHVINEGSFGYTDKSKTLTIDVKGKKTETFADAFIGSTVDYSAVFAGDGTIVVKNLSGDPFDGTVYQEDKKVEYVSVGEYTVTFVGGLVYTGKQVIKDSYLAKVTESGYSNYIYNADIASSFVDSSELGYSGDYTGGTVKFSSAAMSNGGYRVKSAMTKEELANYTHISVWLAVDGTVSNYVIVSESGALISKALGKKSDGSSNIMFSAVTAPFTFNTWFKFYIKMSDVLEAMDADGIFRLLNTSKADNNNIKDIYIGDIKAEKLDEVLKVDNVRYGQVSAPGALTYVPAESMSFSGDYTGNAVKTPIYINPNYKVNSALSREQLENYTHISVWLCVEKDTDPGFLILNAGAINAAYPNSNVSQRIMFSNTSLNPHTEFNTWREVLIPMDNVLANMDASGVIHLFGITYDQFSASNYIYVGDITAVVIN